MTAREGLNLLVYPSPLESAGRLAKLALSLQGSGLFAATEVVGIALPGAPREEGLAPGALLRRVPGASLRSPWGRCGSSSRGSGASTGATGGRA